MKKALMFIFLTMAAIGCVAAFVIAPLFPNIPEPVYLIGGILIGHLIYGYAFNRWVY